MSFDRMRFCVWATLAAAGLSAGAPAQAQPGVDRDSQLWATFVFQGKASDILRGYLELQPRIDTGVTDLNLVIVRGAFSAEIAPQTYAWFGIGRFEGVGSDQVDENRLWQQITYEGTSNPMKVVFRSRFEERFIGKTEGTGLRWRNLVRGVAPIGGENTCFSWVLQNEHFWNLNDVKGGPQSGFDQNRFFIGPNIQLTSKINMDVGYLNQFIQRPSGNNRVNHVLNINTTFNF